MPKIFDRLFFIGPMCLGDSFMMSGMVHYYADRCNELHYPVLPAFYTTLRTLYQDYPNIIVVPLEGYDRGEDQYVKDNQLSRILRIPSEYTNVKNFRLVGMWDIQLYSSYGLEYGLRYSNFRLPRHIEGSEELYQELTQGEPYMLVHRCTGDMPDGIRIDLTGFRNGFDLPNDLKIIEIQEGITDNMMHYVKLIQNAQEIHVVPSSFHCLVESIDTKAKLFFHDVREKTSMSINSPWSNKEWGLVQYPYRF